MLALLAACGGGGAGPQTITGASVGTTLGGAAAQTGTTASAFPELLQNATPVTYRTVGGTQQMVETYTNAVGGFTRSELYTAEQSTVASNKISVAYDPRAAIFSVKIGQANNIQIDTGFQDPAHRTAFGGARQPQAGTPNTGGINYLQVDVGSGTEFERQTLFYQAPGATTRYVGLTGFVRNALKITTTNIGITRTHGSSVFGASTPSDAVPRTGTGSYRGDVIASFVSNTDLDANANLRTRFEWIRGTGQLDLDFATGRITTSMTGTVLPTLDEFDPLNPAAVAPPVGLASWGAMNAPHAGQSFTASGSANYDRNAQSFAGTISSATIGTQTVTIAGSSLDGALFGPTAQEAGYAFRVVGGIPDQRVDISGAFTGVRQ